MQIDILEFEEVGIWGRWDREIRGGFCITPGFSDSCAVRIKRSRYTEDT